MDDTSRKECTKEQNTQRTHGGRTAPIRKPDPLRLPRQTNTQREVASTHRVDPNTHRIDHRNHRPHRPQQLLRTSTTIPEWRLQLSTPREASLIRLSPEQHIMQQPSETDDDGHPSSIVKRHGNHTSDCQRGVHRPRNKNAEKIDKIEKTVINQMSQFDFTSGGNNKERKSERKHQTIPCVSVGTGKQIRKQAESWEGTRGKTTKEKHINSRTTLDLACHARDAQAQERPEVPTRANRNGDRRMTPLGPVRHAEQRQTRHPTSAHEAPSSPSMQGTMSGSEGRATGKKP